MSKTGRPGGGLPTTSFRTAALDDHAHAPRVTRGADFGDADAHPWSMKFPEQDLRHMLGHVFHQTVVLLYQDGADALDHHRVIDGVCDLAAFEYAVVGQGDVQIQFHPLGNGLLALVDADARIQPYFAQKYDVHVEEFGSGLGRESVPA